MNIPCVSKKQIFGVPLSYFLRARGGIHVDRSVHTGFISLVARQFNERDEMVFGLTPEGTRSRTDYWKTGFYYIAREANIPICLAYVDFPSRTIGFGKMITPTGNIEKDFEIIKDFYKDKTGKYPDKQGPVQIRKR